MEGEISVNGRDFDAANDFGNIGGYVQ